ncbi:reverse transcriptase domain-containing protein [Tanacetum coccineum]
MIRKQCGGCARGGRRPRRRIDDAFCRRLYDGGEPRRLWLEEEDSSGVGWRWMMATVIGTTVGFRAHKIGSASSRGDQRTMLDGTLVIQGIGDNHVLGLGNFKLKYTYVHGGLTYILRSSYDLAKEIMGFYGYYEAFMQIMYCIKACVSDIVKPLDVVFDGAFGGVRDEEVVVGEGVVVISSSLDMLTNSCLGGIMVSLIFLEGLDEEALVEFMVEWCEEDEDDDRSGEDDLFN